MDQQSLEKYSCTLVNVFVSFRPYRSSARNSARAARLSSDAGAARRRPALACGSHRPVAGSRLCLPNVFARSASSPDVGPHFRTLQIHYHRSTVVALVGNHLLDALQVCLRFLGRLFCPDQLRRVFTGLR